MEKYGNNDFVVDDDIVKKNSLIIYEIYDKSFNGKTTDKLLKPFNPSKPFKITCSIIFNNISKNNLAHPGFIIVSNRVNLTCCKVQNFSNGTQKFPTSYWFSADDLYEWHYGVANNGVLFEYLFEYKGNHIIPTASSNKPFIGNGGANPNFNPRNLESDTIWFCYDPRDSSSEITNVNIKKLVIEQD